MNQPLSCQILPLVPFAEAGGVRPPGRRAGIRLRSVFAHRRRDSFTVLAALAMHTKHIHLGTAVAPIYHRSPASDGADRGDARRAVRWAFPARPGDRPTG